MPTIDYSVYMDANQATRDRFWRHVHSYTDKGCWLWMHSRTGSGYGAFTIGKKRLSAHRLAFIWATRNLAVGLDLDHLCRNRLCVNPLHLDPVTRAENLQRSPLTGPGRNAMKTVCDRGHDLAGARVSTDARGVQHRTCQKCQNIWRAGVCRFCGKQCSDVRGHEKKWCATQRSIAAGSAAHAD